MGETAVLLDRRRAGGPERTIALHDDRIELSEHGALRTRIALEDVARVRMSVAPVLSGGHAVHCEITASDGRSIRFASLSADGPGRWTNNAPAFMAFTARLNGALSPRAGEVEFVEGQPLRLRITVCAAGLALAMAAGAGLVLAFRHSTLIPGLACGLGVITGLALAWAFRPVAPAPYDPQAYAERMGRASDAGAPEAGEIAKPADRS